MKKKRERIINYKKMLLLYVRYALYPSATFQARINPSNISDIQISCIKLVGNYQRH